MRPLIPLVLALMWGVFGSIAHAQRLDLSPRPKEVRLSGPRVSFNGARLVVVGDLDTSGFSVVLDAVRAAVGRRSDRADAPVIRIRAARYERPQEYRIEVRRVGRTAEAVISGAPDALAAALSTFEELVDETDGRVPTGTLHDWPDHPLRALLLFMDEGTSNMSPFTPMDGSPAGLRRQVDEARGHGFNAVMLRPDMGALGSGRDGWSRQAFADFADYCRASGVEFVLALQLISHQTGSEPFLLNPHTFDVRHVERAGDPFARFAEGLIDDYVGLTGARRVHLGFDEIADAGPQTLAPDEALRYIRWLDRLTARKGLEMWMWADMLVAPDEVADGPEVNVQDFNGGLTVNGRRYASIRDQIPERVVLVDWRFYLDAPDWRDARYPSLDLLARRHPVIGSTFADAQCDPGGGNPRCPILRILPFSRYAYRANQPGRPAAGRVRGMLATTWPGTLRPALVDQRPWLQDHTGTYVSTYGAEGIRRYVSSIVAVSGEAFWNARF